MFEVEKPRSHTPLPAKKVEAMTEKDVANLSMSIRDVLTHIGEDPKREGLLKTPERYAKALEYLTSGYAKCPKKVLNGAIFNEQYDEMVVVKDIELYSLCEHHMLPFFGKAHVAYIPNGKIVGLSKVARMVDVFARRLQVQERLTTEIAQVLVELLEPRGVGVVVEAKHLCMMMRGVEKQNSSMVTSSMHGVFRESEVTRKEFLSLIKFGQA
jgi:GTP cyclohydrolase I